MHLLQGTRKFQRTRLARLDLGKIANGRALPRHNSIGKSHGASASVVVKRVCERCNNEWMSGLETQVRPTVWKLVLGQRADLNSEQQLALALWSTKTAMVFDAARTNGPMYFSPGECTHLFRSMSGGFDLPMPLWTFVWLATYRGNFAAGSFSWNLRGLGQRTDRREEFPVDGHTTTIVMGHFVTQVLTVRLLSQVAKEAAPVPSSDRWNNAVRQVWPIASALVAWQPEQVLDDTNMGIEDFAKRWLIERV